MLYETVILARTLHFNKNLSLEHGNSLNLNFITFGSFWEFLRWKKRQIEGKNKPPRLEN